MNVHQINRLNHSYEALVGGRSWEAMTAFTGGIHEEYSLNHMPPDGFERISRALQHQSLLGCFGVIFRYNQSYRQ